MQSLSTQLSFASGPDLRVMRLSPVSALCAMEPTWDSLSPAPSAPPPLLYKTKWERERWWVGLRSELSLETSVSFPETCHLILCFALALTEMKGLKFICEGHNDRQSSLQVSLFWHICQYLEKSLGNERMVKLFCITFTYLPSPKT